MFAFSAVSVGKLKEIQNGGKRARRGVDQWDRVSFARPPVAIRLTTTAKYGSFTMTSFPY
jgi:hypothetical protein